MGHQSQHFKTLLGRSLGDTVKAFDGSRWQKTGDVGDNSQFWKEAEIIDLRIQKSMLYDCVNSLADVKWKHNGQISRGHFVDGLKPV